MLPSEHVRRVAALGAVTVASALAIVASITSSANSPSRDSHDASTKLPPITPPPLLLRPVAPVEALKINRAIPFSRDANPPARPFKLKGDAIVAARAVECLATAIYYEAGNEPLDGQRAVAQIVLNRVRHPAFVPSVCGVVYQGSTRVTGCQFSFTCDGSMRRRPTSTGWATTRAIAAQALKGAVFAPVGTGTHYHADYVVPYWATSLAKNAVVGRHIFYRWPGWWGTGAGSTAARSPIPVC
jgi:hypothetical protein